MMPNIDYDAIVQTAQRIRDLTNEAIAALQARSDKLDGAINWGDLACVDAWYFIDSFGFSGYRVLVEGASPDAVDLQEYIEDYLLDHMLDVYVVLEW